jgi:hypothetical protein
MLMAAQEVPTRPEPETPATLPIERQGAIISQPTTDIPASEYGRIRTLAKHGMTLEQLAELYEVALDEVKRIISR